MITFLVIVTVLIALGEIAYSFGWFLERARLAHRTPVRQGWIALLLGVVVLLMDAAYVVTVVSVHSVPLKDWVLYLAQAVMLAVLVWQFRALSKARSQWRIVAT